MATALSEGGGDFFPGGCLCHCFAVADMWGWGNKKRHRGGCLFHAVGVVYYQMMARSAGSSHILSPGWMPKASKKVSMFLKVALTR